MCRITTYLNRNIYFKYYFNFPSSRNLLGGVQEKGVTIEGLPVDEESYKKYTEALKLLGYGKEIFSAAAKSNIFNYLWK